MLGLSRKVGETIWIGDDIKIVISKIGITTVSLAIEAPASVKILRGELKDKPKDK